MEYEHYRDAKEFFCDGPNFCNEHFHRAIEVQCCLRQDKHILLDGEEMCLREGELLFVPPFCTHGFPRQEGHRTLAVVFPVSYTDTWEKMAGDKQFASPIFDDKVLVQDVYTHLAMLGETKNPLLRDGIYTYVLGRLSEGGTLTESGRKRSDSFAVRTLSYLEKHYAEKLSLERAAGALGYNYSYFSTLFKKTFRRSFCEYLAMLRVHKSLRLLDSRPIGEVAYAVGFGSVQSYYLSFKRVMQVTPAEYGKR